MQEWLWCKQAVNTHNIHAGHHMINSWWQRERHASVLHHACINGDDSWKRESLRWTETNSLKEVIQSLMNLQKKKKRPLNEWICIIWIMPRSQYIYVAWNVEHSGFKMSWQGAHPTGLQWLIPSHVLLIIWIFPQYCKDESYHDSDLHTAARPNTSRRTGGKNGKHAKKCISL